MSAVPAREARLIGTVLVETKLITSDQLVEALEIQARDGGLLGEIAVERFGISRIALAGVLAERWAALDDHVPTPTTSHQVVQLHTPSPERDPQSHRRIGEVFLDLGLVDEQELEAALVTQRETGERLGEILVKCGVISRLELAEALGEHWSSMQKLRGQGSPPENDSAVLVPMLRTAHSQAAVENARAVPAEHLEHLERLEQRVDELSRISADRDNVREVLSDLSSRAADKQEVTSLRGDLECLSNANAEALKLIRSDDAKLRDTISSVSAALEELRELVLQERDEEGVDVARDAALDALRAQLDDLAASQTDLATHHRDLHSVAINDLRTRIDDLARELGADLDSRTAGLPTRAEIEEHVNQAALDQLSVDVDERINALQASLDDLAATQADLAAHHRDLHPAAINDFRIRLDDLARELGADLDSRTAGLPTRAEIEEHVNQAALDELSVDVDERINALQASLDELSAAQADLAAHHRDLHPAAINDLRIRLDDLARELGADLDSRTASLPTRAEIEDHVNQAALDELSVDVDERINALQVSLDELSAAQADIDRTSAGPTDAEIDALRARLDEMGRRVEHGDEAWALAAERITALEVVAHDQAVQIDTTRSESRAAESELHRTTAAVAARIDEVSAGHVQQAAAIDTATAGRLLGLPDELVRSATVDVPAADDVDTQANDAENDEPSACNAPRKAKKRKRSKNGKKKRS